MKKVTLAHIGTMSSREFALAPSLWVRGERSTTVDDTGAMFLSDEGRYDFTTFFGSLSIKKYETYTNARNFALILSVRGSATIALTEASTFDFEPRVLSQTSVSTASFETDEDGWVELRLDVPQPEYGPERVVVGFIVDCKTPVAIRDSHWIAHIEESAMQSVELALCTTTFKKEEYIIANIKALDDYMAHHAELAAHLTIHVVDNGRTLSVDDVASAHVRLHPNPNAGGAGGFARGMIEAMRQKPRATHVLLMDDDVSMSPESIFRTYALLRVVAPEHREAFISGAMMDYDDPVMRFEDIAYMSRFGTCERIKPPMRMDRLHDVVENEALIPQKDLPTPEKKPEDLFQLYQAWFYCCIPMSEIERRGMPLPLFVRFDDVEFSLRGGLNQKIISLNGICVWHLPFFMRNDPVTANYQVPRNLLLIEACSNAAPHSDIEGFIYRTFRIEMSSFNYQAGELIVAALKDYLAGPDVVFAPGFVESRFVETHKMWNRYAPLTEMRTELEGLGVDVEALGADEIVGDLPLAESVRQLDEKTYNGQLKTSILHRPYKMIPGKVVVVDAASGAYQPGKIHQSEYVVAIDIPNNTCQIRHRDPERFERILKEFEHCMEQCRQNRQKMHQTYREGCAEIKTVEGWKRYLGIDGL